MMQCQIGCSTCTAADRSLIGKYAVGAICRVDLCSLEELRELVVGLRVSEAGADVDFGGREGVHSCHGRKPRRLSGSGR